MIDLRVMSFNIWRSGGLSLETTTHAIARADADIVGLQECSTEAGQTIASAIGYGWVADTNGHVILSRHPLTMIGSTSNVWGGLGALVTIDEKRIHFFDAHLHWDHYGPYWLQEDRSVDEVLREERAMRMPGLEELFAMMKPSLLASSSSSSANEATFLVGDFNAPSHLDYANMPWPTSVACEKIGLEDSYRVMHPDARVNDGGDGDGDGDEPFAFDEPGITWTPIVAEEPRGCFDRIDFIHYASQAPIEVLSSNVIDGRSGYVDTWPSDHRAVLSAFRL